MRNEPITVLGAKTFDQPVVGLQLLLRDPPLDGLQDLPQLGHLVLGGLEDRPDFSVVGLDGVRQRLRHVDADVQAVGAGRKHLFGWFSHINFLTGWLEALAFKRILTFQHLQLSILGNLRFGSVSGPVMYQQGRNKIP